MNNNENNDTFQFGEPINNETDNTFNYEGIVGLGESDYENEDLFNTETLNVDDSFDKKVEAQAPNLEDKSVESSVNTEETNFNDQNSNNEFFIDEKNIDYGENHLENNIVKKSNQDNEMESVDTKVVEVQEKFVTNSVVEEESEPAKEDNLIVESVKESEENLESTERVNEENKGEVLIEESVTSHENADNLDLQQQPLETENSNTALGEIDSSEKVKTLENLSSQNIFSDTPVEEFNKLTQFTDEKVQSTDIKALFDRVGVNVKEASDIFRKNTEMKEKIDSRFEELKKLQAEVEKAKSSQYDEINAYKEEVLNKLTEKKQEIERRIEKLKDYQASLENEKEEFEQYKRKEKEEIERVQKEIQDAYDSRREELSHVEDVLRRQKDSLDEERSQLTLDRIQYESDKNELANNLLKFNEIVDSFTSGMSKLDKE